MAETLTLTTAAEARDDLIDILGEWFARHPQYDADGNPGAAVLVLMGADGWPQPVTEGRKEGSSADPPNPGIKAQSRAYAREDSTAAASTALHS